MIANADKTNERVRPDDRVSTKDLVSALKSMQGIGDRGLPYECQRSIISRLQEQDSVSPGQYLDAVRLAVRAVTELHTDTDGKLIKEDPYTHSIFLEILMDKFGHHAPTVMNHPGISEGFKYRALEAYEILYGKLVPPSRTPNRLKLPGAV